MANIKVSSLPPAGLSSVNNGTWTRRRRRQNKSSNILQLDGAADSSETDSERVLPIIKQEPLSAVSGEEPVKCHRCRRSYRTLQSFNKHAETCVELLSSSSSSGSEEESEEENIAPVQVKQEPMDPESADPHPDAFQLKQELTTPEPATTMEPDLTAVEPIQVPIVNSSSLAPPATPVVPSTAANTAPAKAPSVQRVRQRRQIRPNVSGIPPRPLAARTANNPPPPRQEVRFTVPAPSTMPTFQVTLQSPPPPVIYLTRPELNPCGFISQPTLAPAQPHFIIMQPPMEQFTTQAQLTAPTLSLASQPAPSPMVQYLGAVPSHLLSALGILGVTNYVSNMPTLVQSQPMQIPWESSVPNRIVVLNPQQPQLLSFNQPCVSVEPAKPALKPIKPLEPVKPAESVAPSEPAKIVEPVPPQPSIHPDVESPQVKETEKETPMESEGPTTLDALVESCCGGTDMEVDDAPQTQEATEESCGDRPASSMSDGKPPKPTYSYRSAMSSGASVKNDANNMTDRLIGPTASESSVVQHLKVVAHPSSPDQAARTFHLKALANDPEQQRILSPAEEPCVATTPLSPLDITVDIASSPKEDQVCDVFATPPASSEPPVLPSDMDGGDISSWPAVLPPLASQPGPIPAAAEPKKKEAHIMYELVSDDGFYAKSESLSTVWQTLLDAVQDARLAFKMEPLYNGCLKSVNERSLNLTGLHHHALINLLEQMPNADLCPDYTFRYRTHRDRQSDEKITGSAYGCVRAAPYSGRVPYDMFSWLASQYRSRPELSVRTFSGDQQQQTTAAGTTVDAQPGRRATNFDLLPMTVRFKHLRQTAKNSVGVFRSHIHGRGLFCKRDIEVRVVSLMFCCTSTERKKGDAFSHDVSSQGRQWL